MFKIPLKEGTIKRNFSHFMPPTELYNDQTGVIMQVHSEVSITPMKAPNFKKDMVLVPYHLTTHENAARAGIARGIYLGGKWGSFKTVSLPRTFDKDAFVKVMNVDYSRNYQFVLPHEVKIRVLQKYNLVDLIRSTIERSSNANAILYYFAADQAMWTSSLELIYDLQKYILKFNLSPRLSSVTNAKYRLATKEEVEAIFQSDNPLFASGFFYLSQGDSTRIQMKHSVATSRFLRKSYDYISDDLKISEAARIYYIIEG